MDFCKFQETYLFKTRLLCSNTIPQLKLQIEMCAQSHCGYLSTIHTKLNTGCWCGRQPRVYFILTNRSFYKLLSVYCGIAIAFATYTRQLKIWCALRFLQNLIHIWIVIASLCSSLSFFRSIFSIPLSLFFSLFLLTLTPLEHNLCAWAQVI